MPAKILNALGFVMRPSVALVFPYGYVMTVWLTELLITSRYAKIGNEVPLVSVTALVCLSVVNAAFLAALVFDGRAAWRCGRGVRRGPLAGVVLAAVNVVGLEALLLLAHRVVVAG